MDVQRVRVPDQEQEEAEEVPLVRSDLQGHSGTGEVTGLMAMPRDERQTALFLIEWAYDHPNAATAAPEEVQELRKFMDAGLGLDQRRWEEAFNRSLRIWKADRELQQRSLF